MKNDSYICLFPQETEAIPTETDVQIPAATEVQTD